MGVPQILDGDVLSQFLELTSLQQHAILSSDLLGSSGSKTKFSKSTLPVDQVVQLLERLLNSLS
uniref:Cleavage/polyadenylation specificity factor A subunit C-terminal domain-containing protein n=14 Tax=Nymphaea colorata TaxID=210225 RepID=A0A5K1EH99_9MAGN